MTARSRDDLAATHLDTEFYNTYADTLTLGVRAALFPPPVPPHTPHFDASKFDSEDFRSIVARVDAALTSHPWWPDALRLRRYDDAAKDPKARGVPISDVLTIAERVMAQRQSGRESGGESA